MGENRNSGPVELIRGLIEGPIGIAKQLVGTVINRGDMVREGQAQEDKADAQRSAAKKEAAAEAARASAKAAEEKQKSYQK
jgi:hypothetical protein